MILIREEDRIEAERQRKRLLLAYIAVACLYVVAALLLLFLSPDRYKLFLAGDILLSVLFGFASIYFFTIVYDFAKKRSKLLDKISGALTEKEYGVFLREEDRMTIEGLEMRVVFFEIRGDERELHVFENDFSFEKEKRYLLEMRCGVITVIGDVDE